MLICQVLGNQAAQAQVVAPTVTEADIERARQAQPTITDQDLQRARARHRAPNDAELRGLPVPSTPKIDALPRPASSASVDLQALARGFDTQVGQVGLGARPGPTLLVFISFAMPEATLSRLVDQAARAQASLVLRGLVDGSLVRTVSRMQQLIGTRKVAALIDPMAFDRYAVTHTPAFVLLGAGAQAQPCTSLLCASGDDFVMAAGDVSLDYALAYFQRSAPAHAQAAAGFRKRLKG